MEFKGTPGPWEYEADNGWECMVTTSKDTHYIEVKNHDMAEDACIEMYHNAKLIEAAPAMLQALQDIKYTLESPGLIDAGDLRRITNSAINKALK